MSTFTTHSENGTRARYGASHPLGEVALDERGAGVDTAPAGGDLVGEFFADGGAGRRIEERVAVTCPHGWNRALNERECRPAAGSAARTRLTASTSSGGTSSSHARRRNGTV